MRAQGVKMSQVNNNYGNSQGATAYGNTSSNDIPDDPVADAAKAKMDAYLQAIQGGIPQDAKDAIAKFWQIFANPQNYIQYDGPGGPSGVNGWAAGSGNGDVASQIEFAAFMNENYGWKTGPNTCNGVNPLTASLFALFGLRTWDNASSDSDYNMNVPNTSVFQSIINTLQGGMSQDDLKSTLGDLGNAKDQIKLNDLRLKVQPLLNFANHVVGIINDMVSFCQQNGLGSGTNPCWNICRQWNANGGHGSKWEPPVHADSSWSRDELKDRRNYYVYNDFGISGSDFVKQVDDFLNDFNSLSQ